MFSRLTLAQKGLILVIVPIIVDVVFVLCLSQLLRQAEQDFLLENQSKTIVAEANDLLNCVYDVGLALGLYATTEEESFLKQFDQAAVHVPEQLSILEDLTSKDPIRSDQFKQVKEAAVALLAAQQHQKVKMLKKGGHNFFGQRAHIALQDLMAAIHRMVAYEKKLQQSEPAQKANSRNLVVHCLFAGVFFNILMGISLAVFFNTGTTRRLKVLMDNTFRLVKHEKLNEPIAGLDEIAHLDFVFHDMAKALDEAERHKRQLVNMVSHDLRTPLTSIQAALELLTSGALGELSARAKRESSVAEFSATRLLHLINDLLDIEKMEAGKLQINKAPILLAPLLDQAVDTVRPYADLQEVKIERSPTDATVLADSDRLIQVIINLVANAAKFSDLGGIVKIEVDDSDDWTRVKVVDGGPGVPVELQTKIWEPFEQVSDGSTSRGGSGLGLSICKTIVEAHGGQVGCDSVVGAGSTFWVQLPKGLL